MKKYALTSLFILLCSVFVFAQTDNKKNIEINCPAIEVIPPPAAVKSGEGMNFAVLLDKASEGLNLEYRWSVDKGKIFVGQGTDNVTVLTDGLEYTTITATVKIEGLPKACPKKFSETGIITANPSWCSLDEFGELARDDIRARIDNLYILLGGSDPTTKALIINYGMPKDVTRRLKIIKEHIKFRGLSLDRVYFRYKGVEPNIRTKLWLVPAGADDSELN